MKHDTKIEQKILC